MPSQLVTRVEEWGLFASHLPLGELCHNVTLQKTLLTAPKASARAFPTPFSEDASHFVLE